MPPPPRQPPALLSLDTASPLDSPQARPRTPVQRADDRRLQVETHCGHLRLCPDNASPAFELLVLGCGGGPLENNLSSYLVKPYAKKWTDGCTGIEGGSTIGAMAALVERNPYAFEGFGLEIGVDADELEGALRGEEGGVIGVGREGGGKAAAKVWDLISCFAITHAHLDHIAGLIISSAACRPPPKPVWGIKRTIQNIERMMDGGVWPMLGGWDDSVTIGKAYHYKHIPAPTTSALPLSPSLTFHAFPLSHGLDPSAFHRKPSSSSNGANGVKKACDECYDSTAFFVREETTGKELLFFGDVEPDSISNRSLNLDIWKVAAPKIASGKLNIIFLECSYPSSQPANRLYGHFSPPFILEEMVVLADLVRNERLKAGLDPAVAAVEPLQDVIVVIQHIKDDIFALPPKPASPTAPSSIPPSNRTSIASEKDLPPLPPPKEPSSRHSTASAPSPTKPSFRPPFAASQRGAAGPPPALSSSTRSSTSASASADSNELTRATELLSMSPPVPSVPTRRPSSAFGVGGAFPQSPLATALSRNSYRLSVAAGAAGGHPPLAGSGGAGVGGLGAWQASLADAQFRRASTPSLFAAGYQPHGGPVSPGRMALSPPPQPQPASPHSKPVSHSAPPGSATGRGGLAPAFEFNGAGGGGGSRGVSPSRLSQYAFPPSGRGVDAVVEEDESASPALPSKSTLPSSAYAAAAEEEEEEEEEETVEETVHERIERELNELEEKEKTGVRFLIAVQGMRLVF